jgi:hypothetical protein
VLPLSSDSVDRRQSTNDLVSPRPFHTVCPGQSQLDMPRFRHLEAHIEVEGRALREVERDEDNHMGVPHIEYKVSALEGKVHYTISQCLTS